MFASNTFATVNMRSVSFYLTNSFVCFAAFFSPWKKKEITIMTNYNSIIKVALAYKTITKAFDFCFLIFNIKFPALVFVCSGKFHSIWIESNRIKYHFYWIFGVLTNQTKIGHSNGCDWREAKKVKKRFTFIARIQCWSMVNIGFGTIAGTHCEYTIPFFIRKN